MTSQAPHRVRDRGGASSENTSNGSIAYGITRGVLPTRILAVFKIGRPMFKIWALSITPNFVIWAVDPYDKICLWGACEEEELEY